MHVSSIYQGLASAALCLLLSSCAPANRKSDVLDIYELPTNGRGGNAPAVDNDSYYTQPGAYKGCAVINDAPSCGGGG